MNVDSLPEAVKGTPITADQWNAVVAALRQSGLMVAPEMATAGGTTAIRKGLPRGDWVPFTCAEEVPAGSVLVAAGVEGAATDERVGLTLRKTDTLGRRPLYVSGDGVVPIGETGRAMRSPRVPVLVAFDAADGTPVAGQVWGPVADSFKLRSGVPGFRCLTAGDEASGLVWCEYDGVEEPSYDATLSEDLASGGEADAVVEGGGGPTATVAAPWTLGTDKTIPSGKKIRAKWRPAYERLEVPGAAEC